MTANSCFKDSDLRVLNRFFDKPERPYRGPVLSFAPDLEWDPPIIETDRKDQPLPYTPLSAAAGRILGRNRTLLQRRWNSTSPGYGGFMVDPDRSSLPRIPDRVVPCHLLTVEWNDETAFAEGPIDYSIALVPGFGRYVVIEAAHWIDDFPYRRFAIGHFPISRSLLHGVRDVLKAVWRARRSAIFSGRPELISPFGLVDIAAFRAWRRSVWGGDKADWVRRSAAVQAHAAWPLIDALSGTDDRAQQRVFRANFLSRPDWCDLAESGTKNPAHTTPDSVASAIKALVRAREGFWEKPTGFASSVGRGFRRSHLSRRTALFWHIHGRLPTALELEQIDRHWQCRVPQTGSIGGG